MRTEKKPLAFREVVITGDLDESRLAQELD